MERVCILFFWLAMVLVPVPDVFSNSGDFVGTREKDFSLFEENGKVGLKDDEGQVLIPAAYEAIGWSNGKFLIVDKVVGYRRNGMWGLIHTSNKIVTPAEYLSLVPADASLVIAQKRSLSQRPAFGILNTAGKVVIPFDYDGLKLSNMRAVVTLRSAARYQAGLIDMSHRILIPLEYRNVYSLGSLRYAVENFDDKIAIFSDEGRQLTPFNIDSISSFKKDYAVIYQNNFEGIIDRNGQVVVPASYRSVAIKEDGTIGVRDPDTWYFIEADNIVKGELQADWIRPVSAERYISASGSRLRLLDHAFSPVHEGFFSTVGDFSKGLATFRHNGKAGVIREDGQVVIPAKYEDIIADGTFFIAAMNTGYANRWVILNPQGKVITGKQYQAIMPFNGTYHAVKNRGFWGAVDASGREIISCVHDSLLQQVDDRVVVKFKGQYGIIDIRENWIVTPQPNPIQLLDGNNYFEYSSPTTFLKSTGGDIIYFSENTLEYQGDHIRETLATGAWWAIDMNGIVTGRSAHPDGTDRIFSESEGYRAIFKDGKYGFIDDQGRLRIANRYEDVQPFSNGMAAVRIRGRWGFINRGENLVVQPIYDQVENFQDGVAIVRQENLWGLVDNGGKTILPIRYDGISANGHGRFRLRQGAFTGLADSRGNVVVQPRFETVEDNANGYAIVSRGGKFGLITTRGVSTIPMIYDSIAFDKYRNRYMALKKSAWKTAPIR